MMSCVNIKDTLEQMGRRARRASQALAALPADAKRACLEKMAEALEANADTIKKINSDDVEKAKSSGLSSAMVDRLTLTDARIKDMANGLRTVAAQSDPVNKILSSVTRPNGLEITKVSVPFGVIGIIYEARPNVTADAAGICLKAGNVVILRGGSEAFNSNMIIAGILNKAATECGLPEGTVQLIPWTDREAVKFMLKMDRYAISILNCTYDS